MTQSLTDNGSREPVFVVGVGASAGGLEALSQLFEALPVDTGCAFVVIQHLSPEHRSVMDELLGRRTLMPVTVAGENTRLHRDTVHLIPPGKNLALREGCLHLLEPTRDRGINLPIDLFFASLADDAGNRAVAIILSGTGSDGSRGIRNIKEAGGLVLVQDPESAQFDGMPRSALHTELTDFTLDPAGIASCLEDYVRHPLAQSSGLGSQVELDANDDVLADIFSLLLQHTKVDFSQYKPATIARRLERRLGINRLNSLEDYRALLVSSDKELRILGREMFINVTNFFRDSEAFDYLDKNVIHGIVENAQPEQDVRVWVAGCSTGEEAYSIAILLDEAFLQAGKPRRLKIFATDVDKGALAEASPGHFTSAIERDVSPARLQRYFEALDDGYVLKQEIRQLVVFAQHDMMSDPPFSNLDLVCCRNVMIYFQHAMQQKVMSTFHFSLRRGGYAFFGSAESIGDLDAHFEVVHSEFRLFRKQGEGRALLMSASSRRASINTTNLQPIESMLKGYRAQPKDNMQDELRDVLLTDFMPATLVLDERFQALHLYGDASKYLTRFPAGKVTNRVQDIMPAGLSVTVTSALSRARKENGEVTNTAVAFELDGQKQLVDLTVRYLPGEEESLNGHFIVVLRPRLVGSGTDAFAEDEAINANVNERTSELQSLLLSERQHRQVTTEELESTNEELQSSNEELIASNEELQSTNEELQSVNEELFTVNSEFQEKIAELSRATDDLDVLMSFTTIGFVFVDANRCVRRFSKLATQYFRLLPSDVGRPLAYVACELEDNALLEDIDSVLASGTSIKRPSVTRTGSTVGLQLIAQGPGVTGREGAGQRSVIIVIVDQASPATLAELPTEASGRLLEVSRPDNDVADSVVKDVLASTE